MPAKVDQDRSISRRCDLPRHRHHPLFPSHDAVQNQNRAPCPDFPSADRQAGAFHFCLRILDFALLISGSQLLSAIRNTRLILPRIFVLSSFGALCGSPAPWPARLHHPQANRRMRRPHRHPHLAIHSARFQQRPWSRRRIVQFPPLIRRPHDPPSHDLHASNRQPHRRQDGAATAGNKRSRHQSPRFWHPSHGSPVRVRAATLDLTDAPARLK